MAVRAKESHAVLARVTTGPAPARMDTKGRRRAAVRGRENCIKLLHSQHMCAHHHPLHRPLKRVRCVLCGDVAGVQCTKPDAPDHGTVTGGNGKYPNAKATFSCDAEYHRAPSGTGVVDCGTDGRYDSPPSCRACTAIAHCKPGSLQCQTNLDQKCKTKGDCEAGYTQNRQCGGECCP